MVDSLTSKNVGDFDHLPAAEVKVGLLTTGTRETHDRAGQRCERCGKVACEAGDLTYASSGAILQLAVKTKRQGPWKLGGFGSRVDLTGSSKGTVAKGKRY